MSVQHGMLIGMGRKTSVWLSDDLVAAWQASRLPLAELVRRGLGADAGGPVDEVTLRRVLREELSSLPVASAGRPQSGYGSGYASEPFEDIP